MLARVSGGMRQWAATALVAFALGATLERGAAEPVVHQDTGDAPVVRIAGGRGAIVVRTWDRNTVEVDSPNPEAVEEQRGAMRFGAVPRSFLIPPQTALPNRPDGPIVLPPEEFVVSNAAPGMHDAIVVRAHDAPVTVTIPATTSLLVVNAPAGRIDVEGYHGGAFVVVSHGAAIALRNDGGNGFVQSLLGPVAITDSNFEHIRARTGLRALRFERCTVREVQATSVHGNIVYDAGSFVPGLARFESLDGNVAIGVASGGVAIGARSPNGRIYSSLPRGASVDQRGGEATASVNGGGPLVNASTLRGSIFLYDGTLRAKKNLSSEWDAIRESGPEKLREPQGSPGIGPPPHTTRPASVPRRERRDRRFR